MPRVNRRDILASLSSSFVLASSPAAALVCDVHRAREGGISTKSYSCQLDDNRSLTTTFMRVNDVLADSAGRSVFADDLQDLDSIIAGTHIVENDTLRAFNALMEDFSTPFFANRVSVRFDGRDDQIRQDFTGSYLGSTRLRTLDTWDDAAFGQYPFFPLPAELERAFVDPSESNRFEFLRFATPRDFEDFEQKTEQYLSYWQREGGQTIGQELFGNLRMLEHIRAGSVDNFLPLFFASSSMVTCGGEPAGGAYYAHPPLLVDFMVCRNDGDAAIRIDDFVGANDPSSQLRVYNPTTPPDMDAFGWRPVELQPGESVIAVQRLLFSQRNGYAQYLEDPTIANRAVFGATQLPKGVVIAGEAFSFDGRSHNSMIALSSDREEACCPFLMAWCELAQEWVTIGKVLTRCIGAELEGKDTRQFAGLQTRFKITEREHERTFLNRLSLTLNLQNGTRIDLPNPTLNLALDIGQSHEATFEIPKNLCPTHVVSSTLTLEGYYEKYNHTHFNKPGKRTYASL